MRKMAMVASATSVSKVSPATPASKAPSATSASKVASATPVSKVPSSTPSAPFPYGNVFQTNNTNLIKSRKRKRAGRLADIAPVPPIDITPVTVFAPDENEITGSFQTSTYRAAKTPPEPKLKAKVVNATPVSPLCRRKQSTVASST